jgi:CBS domain-containing protein
MATLRHILAEKGSHVWTVNRDAFVLPSVHRMNESHIGSLVVLDGDDVVGIFSERDLLRRVVGENRDPATTRVGDVMTTSLIWGTDRTTVEEARTIMRDYRVRHLPMRDEDGRLCGIISIGDLNAYLLATQEFEIHELHEYLYGRT